MEERRGTRRKTPIFSEGLLQPKIIEREGAKKRKRRVGSHPLFLGRTILIIIVLRRMRTTIT
jgi:hypothetical protein